MACSRRLFPFEIYDAELKIHGCFHSSFLLPPRGCEWDVTMFGCTIIWKGERGEKEEEMQMDAF